MAACCQARTAYAAAEVSGIAMNLSERPFVLQAETRTCVLA
jgi:hypothetical protein